MRISPIGAALFASAMLMGCYKASFIQPGAVAGEEVRTWTSFFLWGLVGDEELDVREFCPNGRVAKVQTGAGVGTTIVSCLTLGIYNPRRVIVTCDARTGANAGRSLAVFADENGKPIAVEIDDGHGNWQTAKIIPQPNGSTLISSAEGR